MKSELWLEATGKMLLDMQLQKVTHLQGEKRSQRERAKNKFAEFP